MAKRRNRRRKNGNPPPRAIVPAGTPAQMQPAQPGQAPPPEEPGLTLPMGSLVALLTLSTTVLVTTLTTSDSDIFKSDTPVRIPIFDLQLSIKSFTILVPLLIFPLHWYVLVLVKMTSGYCMGRPLVSLSPAITGSLYRCIPIEGVGQHLNYGITCLALGALLLPIFVLMMLAVWFLKNQSIWLSGLHIGIVLLDGIFVGLYVYIPGRPLHTFMWGLPLSIIIGSSLIPFWFCLKGLMSQNVPTHWIWNEFCRLDVEGETLVLASPDPGVLQSAILEGELSEKDLAIRLSTPLSLRSRSFRGANLERALLYRADLTGCDLRGADLERAVLVGADLSRANLSGATLCEANLTGAWLSRTNLSAADLTWAILCGTDLESADLRGAKMVSSHLQGARFCVSQGDGKEPTGKATLSGATLYKAHFYANDFDPTQFADADVRSTVWSRPLAVHANTLRVISFAGSVQVSRLLEAMDNGDKGLQSMPNGLNRCGFAPEVQTALESVWSGRPDLHVALLRLGRISPEAPPQDWSNVILELERHSRGK